MRKINYSVLMAGIAGVFCLLLAAGAGAKSAEEHFSVKEYNEFHDVLHPLQHDALPAKDFQRIRSNSAALLKHGQAIVRVGIPKGTPKAKSAEFSKELKNFKDALAKFRTHAKDGTDAQLESSFAAVHDSFEMLAGMLPRK